MNIIFDLDGTLLNTIEDLANSTNHALASCGFPTHTTDEIRQMVGNGATILIQRAMPVNYSQKDFQQCFDAFIKHYSIHSTDNTKPYDGILPLLQALKAQKIPMAIVSNKPNSAVRELNNRFFSDYIDIAIGETSETNRKPSPDMLYKAMDLLKSNKQNTIYIGDSEVDIKTAHNAGIPCISVLWGFRDKEFLIKHGATTFVNTPNNILDVIIAK